MYYSCAAPYRNAGVAGPAASISTTATDMAKWMEFVLSDGKAQDGATVVPEEAMTRLYRGELHFLEQLAAYFRKPAISATEEYSQYGLGYFVGYHRGLFIEHN